MRIIFKTLVTCSFFITMVNSTPRPSADDLDPIFDDALNTDIFFDGMSNNDDLTAFTPPMNLFNSDLTTDPNLIGAQDNLLAFDTNTDNSCSAEESQPFSAIGKLRRREDGKSCTSPTKESSEQTVDPFLLQLPIVDEVAAPEIKSRKDICPVYLFDFRDIALCSAAVPQTMLTLGGNTITTISDAMFCTFLTSSLEGCLCGFFPHLSV